MRIFLTGGTGFIGSHFLNESVNYNFKIRALKRENSQWFKKMRIIITIMAILPLICNLFINKINKI